MGRLSALLVVACCACSFDESGELVRDDAGAEANVDVIAQPDVADESQPQTCSLPPGSCIASIPSGWSLIAWDPNAQASCPSNYVEGSQHYAPVAQATACDCDCTETAPPNCTSGSLQRYTSNNASCSNATTLLSIDGTCSAWTGGGLAAYGKGNTLPPVDGTCTATQVSHTSDVSSKLGRVCTPPAECVEDLCEGSVPAGLSLCVVAAGAQNCPSGFPSGRLVLGDDVSLSCSACTCDPNSASTCTNATLSYFSDPGCNTTLATLPVDGTCAPDPAMGKTPAKYKYQADVNPKCTATGPKTATVSLVNQKTVCCKQ